MFNETKAADVSHIDCVVVQNVPVDAIELGLEGRIFGFKQSKSIILDTSSLGFLEFPNDFRNTGTSTRGARLKGFRRAPSSDGSSNMKEKLTSRSYTYQQSFTSSSVTCCDELEEEE